jgi:hypothetical protein
VHLCLSGPPNQSSCFSEASLSCFLIVTSSPLHTGVTPVRKATCPHSHVDHRFEIIYHSACCLPPPIGLITCGWSGAGDHSRLFFVFGRHQFSSLSTQTPPGLSCLAPSSAMMDVSGWMGPGPPPALRPYSSAPTTRPCPAGARLPPTPWSTDLGGFYWGESPTPPPPDPDPQSWEGP